MRGLIYNDVVQRIKVRLPVSVTKTSDHGDECRKGTVGTVLNSERVVREPIPDRCHSADNIYSLFGTYYNMTWSIECFNTSIEP